MAAYRHQPTVAVDHAFAAEGWARESGNRLQQAATADAVARVLSSVRRNPVSLRMLGRAQDTVGSTPGGSGPTHLFWLGPKVIQRDTLFCSVHLRRYDQAVREAQRLLADRDPAWLRERGMTLVDYATAFPQAGDPGSGATAE